MVEGQFAKKVGYSQKFAEILPHSAFPVSSSGKKGKN
jgi:hypothetical protein